MRSSMLDDRFMRHAHPTSVAFHDWVLLSDDIIFLYHADVPSEKETSGYIFIHAEGGLNQQRIAVCMHSCPSPVLT